MIISRMKKAEKMGECVSGIPGKEGSQEGHKGMAGGNVAGRRRLLECPPMYIPSNLCLEVCLRVWPYKERRQMKMPISTTEISSYTAIGGMLYSTANQYTSLKRAKQARTETNESSVGKWCGAAPTLWKAESAKAKRRKGAVVAHNT